MEAKELDRLFETNGKSNRHFIQWVERVSGEKFFSSEVTEHRNGNRKMSRAIIVLYKIYFKILELQ